MVLRTIQNMSELLFYLWLKILTFLCFILGTQYCALLYTETKENRFEPKIKNQQECIICNSVGVPGVGAAKL